MGEEPRLGVFSIEEAQARLAELLDRAAAGEEVIIARDGEAPLRLRVEEAKPKPKRKPGTLKGKINIGPEFFEPMSEDELALWYNDGEL